MPLKDIAVVQGLIEDAIVNINTALEDSVNAGNIADPVKYAQHPLRNINQLMRIVPGTGQFQIDLSFFNPAFGGTAYGTTKNSITID